MAEEAQQVEETILIQYRDFENDDEFSDPATVVEKLCDWLVDPKRSSHFHVRVRRRLVSKGE